MDIGYRLSIMGKYGYGKPFRGTGDHPVHSSLAALIYPGQPRIPLAIGETITGFLSKPTHLALCYIFGASVTGYFRFVVSSTRSTWRIAPIGWFVVSFRCCMACLFDAERSKVNLIITMNEF